MNYRKHHIGPKIRGLRKKEKLWKKPWFWGVLLFMGIAAMGLYGFYFLPLAQIKAITISGNQEIPSQDITTAVERDVSRKLFSIASRSIFIQNTKAISASIQKEFPPIETVAVRKAYPATLVITITERQPVAAFCRDSQCLSIDKDGVTFEQPTGKPNGLVITGDHPDKKVMDMIGRVQKILKDTVQLDVIRVAAANPVVMTTQEGWKLHLDPKGDVDGQITRLKALLTNHLSAGARKKLDYIYLQYQDRAYYK